MIEKVIKELTIFYILFCLFCLINEEWNHFVIKKEWKFKNASLKNGFLSNHFWKQPTPFFLKKKILHIYTRNVSTLFRAFFPPFFFRRKKNWRIRVAKKRRSSKRRKKCAFFRFLRALHHTTLWTWTRMEKTWAKRIKKVNKKIKMEKKAKKNFLLKGTLHFAKATKKLHKRKNFCFSFSQRAKPFFFPQKKWMQGFSFLLFFLRKKNEADAFFSLAIFPPIRVAKERRKKKRVGSYKKFEILFSKKKNFLCL